VYCAGIAGVVMVSSLAFKRQLLTTVTQTFPSATTSSFPAFLLGSALTAVVFLSLIGFSLRRTNVLETSLVFVYVVVCLYSQINVS
jgi:hypothetical protein